MNKNKLLEELKKQVSDKKFSNILVICLILIFSLIAVNYFVTNNTKEKKKEKDSNISYDDALKVSYNSKYEKKETKALESLLEEMEGVGNVVVKINFESDEVKVPAYESTSQKSTTEENDNSGGTRVNEQNNESSTIVKSDDEPYILKVDNPSVIGIAVIADGANDTKIKSQIEKVVCSLYDLPVNKVNVYPRKK